MNPRSKRLFLGLVVVVAAGCGTGEPGARVFDDCAVDTDCRDGLYCGLEKWCIPVGAYQICSDDPDCPGGWYCGEGDLCRPEGFGVSCAEDDECMIGYFCAPDNQCLPRPDHYPVACDVANGCAGESECTEMGYCVEGAAALGSTCSTDVDCPEGFSCLAGTGAQPNGACALRCYPYLPFQTCPAGSVCMEQDSRGACMVMCTTPDDCMRDRYSCMFHSGYSVCWKSQE